MTPIHFRLLCLLMTFSILSAAQTPKTGTLRVKLKEGVSQKLNGREFNSGKFGLAEIDQYRDAFHVQNVRRVFKESTKFEKAHRKFGLHLWYEVSFDGNIPVAEVIKTFKGLETFEVVEPTMEYTFVEPIKSTAVGKAFSSSINGTNDPMFSQQWHYDNNGQSGGSAGADISLSEAWTIETGSDEIIVAVIDGGIDVAHPDLAQSMWVNEDEIPDNGIDDDNNGYIDDINGYAFGDATGFISPHYHGTHVGGTISAVTNNGVGVSGIAGGDGSGNGVRLMSLATFGYWGTGGFEDAMVYAADNGAVISQNSWRGGSTAIEAAIDYFIARAGYDNTDENFNDNIQIGPMAGGIVIFAAGNDSWTEGYPAGYPPVMAVASTDHNDQKSWFSNYGEFVDISAPGSDVFSTYPLDEGSYSYLSGTSMACPHVSGVAALIISQFGGNSFTPDQVWDRLQLTSDNIDAANPGYEGMLGAGRVNAFNAIQTDDDIPPAQTTDLTIVNEYLNSLVLTWTSPGGSGVEGIATGYDIRYAQHEITEENFNDATRVTSQLRPQSPGNTETLEVTGLQHNTTYYIALKTRDFSGNFSAISNVASAATLPPPLIVISPDSLYDTLFSGSEAINYLTISNAGQSDLVFSAQGIAASSPETGGVSIEDSSFKGLNSLATGHKTDSSIPRAAPIPELIAKRPTTTTVSDSSSIKGGRLFSVDYATWMIIELNPTTGEVINQFSAPAMPSGGPDGLAFDGDFLYYTSAYMSNAIYKIDPKTGSVIKTVYLSVGSIDGLAHSGEYLYGVSYATSTIYEIDFDREVVLRSLFTGGVSGGLSFAGKRGSLFASNYSGEIIEIDLTSGEVVNGYSTGYYTYGLGYSNKEEVLFVARANNYSIDALNPDDGTTLYSLYAHSTGIASDEGGYSKWLIPDDSVFTIAAGSSVEVPVLLNAAKKIGGLYVGHIKVLSNDPLTPQVEIPVSLTVIGAPNLVIIDSIINFNTVFITDTAEVEIKIENTGTDQLVIENITFSDSAFTAVDSSFTINADDERALIIRFSPSDDIGYEEILTIATNDPDQPLIEIQLVGTGVHPPIIQVIPGNLSDSLLSNEQRVHEFVISNVGQSDLHFEIVAYAESEPASTTGNSIAGIDKFVELTDSPYPMTAFASDPNSGLLYAQRNGSNEFYEFSASTNTWRRLSDAPFYLGNNGGATYLNGRIYTSSAEYNFIGVYEIASDSWNYFTSGMTTGNITTDGTYLYITYGYYLMSIDPNTFLSTILAYAPFEFSPRGGLAYHKGSIYGHAGNNSNAFAKYSITTDTWTTLSPVPGGTVLGATIDPDEEMFYCYGTYGSNSLYLYDISTDNWTTEYIPYFYVNDGGLANVDQDGVYIIEGENGTGLAKYKTINHAGWIKFESNTGTIGAGEHTTVPLTLDATDLIGGVYEGTALILSNDPVSSSLSVPITLHVTAIADIHFSDSILSMGAVTVGATIDTTLTIINAGTDLLSGSITSQSARFSAVPGTFYLLPGEQVDMTITYTPSVAGPSNSNLVVNSNDDDEPTILLPISGEGIVDGFAMDRDSILVELARGEYETRTLNISNLTSYQYSWQLIAGSVGHETGIEAQRAQLNTAYYDIINHIPNYYQFYEGDYGYYIEDGGTDMYDYGNYLETQYNPYIPYTNGEIVATTDFGLEGKYFTVKYPGLFVMSAEINLENFTIRGGLGADNYGNVDGDVITQVINGVTYKGIIKRVYHTGDASVNHLIIVKDNGMVSHTFHSHTDSDFHQIENLGGVTHISYLLFAGAGSEYYSNEVMSNVMQAYLQTISAGPAWITYSPQQGSLDGDSEVSVTLGFDSGDVTPGTYNADLTLHNSIPGSPTITIPVTMIVESGPNQIPIVVETIPTQVMQTDHNDIVIDLSGYFYDYNNDPLTYSASSENEETGLATVNGTFLYLDAKEVGNSVITVSAADAVGSAITSFLLVVNQGPTPPRLELTPSRTYVVMQPNEKMSINLTMYNAGENLMYWTLSGLPFWANADVTSGSIYGFTYADNAININTEFISTGIYSLPVNVSYNNNETPVLSLEIIVQVSDNQAPYLHQSIPEQNVYLETEGAILHLDDYFKDADGTALTFHAFNEGDAIVSLAVNGSRLRILPDFLGQTLVRVKANDQFSFTETSFFVNVHSVLDAEDTATLSSLNVYPNPIEGRTIVSYFLKNQSRVKLRVIDFNGKVVETLADQNELAGTKEMIIDATKYSSGVYQCQLFIDGKLEAAENLVKAD